MNQASNTKCYNILTLNYEFPPLGGGAASVSYEIAKRYVEKGFKVDVVTMDYKGLPDYEVIEGINIFRVKCLRRRVETCETFEMLSYVLSATAFLFKRLKKTRYDFCHCHFLIPTGVVALFLKYRYNLPFLVTIHGSDIPGYNPDRFKNEHYFTAPLLKLIAKNANNICSPSFYLKKLAEDKLGNLNITHIPNGIDLVEFKLNLSKPKEKIILSSGRLLKRKGFQTLIKAVRDIDSQYEVHIAGDGPYRQQLEEMAKESRTKIVFHGWLNKGSVELNELYEKAAIYVLVSSNESFGIALLEGMAARCAVISTNATGCLETVGDAGFLINFDDDKRLREVIIELFHDSEMIEKYANKAYSRVVSCFLWDDIIDKYLETFI